MKHPPALNASITLSLTKIVSIRLLGGSGDLGLHRLLPVVPIIG
jgi:hypothetical protein